MTTQSSNVLLVLANAVDKFSGNLAECQQNANFLLSDLAGVDIAGLQVLGFGKLQSEAFLLSLKSLAEFAGKRHSAQTKAFINHIFSLLLDASNKQTIIEKAAHDAEMAAIAQHPILAELDNCLNAQIATSRPAVAIANNCKEFANVENAAAEEGVELAGYFDLYSDAGWELDFDPMQLEQIQSIYAAAKEQDGDDDDKTSADELVEQFAKFIHKQLFEKRNAFDKLIDSSDCEVSLFAYDLMINKSTKILLRVKGSGNVCLKHLCSGNGNGSVCSVSFCIHQCQFFKTFYCFKMETFFKDILQDNL